MSKLNIFRLFIAILGLAVVIIIIINRLYRLSNPTPTTNQIPRITTSSTSDTATVPVRDKYEWRVFKGAWFDIKYPSDFIVQRSYKSIPSTSEDAYESAFFISSDKDVAFYIFSPLWNDDPKDIWLDPKTEKITDTKTEQSKDKIITTQTIQALDGSYTRTIEDTNDTIANTWQIYGFKYKDEASRLKYIKDWEHFYGSLIQYAD
ncbi:MAG: hypothetical protein Q7S24_00680 [bacterium]|nr:hypothetical protein [bacterium]